MPSITNFYAPDPYDVKRPASLSTIATNASSIPFTAEQSAARVQSNEDSSSHSLHKKMPRQQFPFLLSLILSSIFSHHTHKLSATAIVCHRTNNHDCIIPPPLLSQLSIHSTIDPIFSLRHFHFIYIFVTLQSLCKSATNILVYRLPHTPTKPPNSFKIFKFNYFKLNILLI